MLTLRALGSASSRAALGLRASASLAPTAASGSVAICMEQAAGASRGWSSVLENYGRAASRLTVAGTWAGRQDDEGQSKASRAGLHTGAPQFVAQQQPGSTFNDPDATAREAGRPTSGGPSPSAGGGGGMGATEGSGASYALLAGAHAGLAATCFLAPTAIANFFFPGAALPQGFESQALVKLLGCGAATGAAASLGLKQLADGGQLASPTAQRLQLGLMGFSSGAIALHALYSPSLTMTSLMAGAAVMGVTALVPYQHYVKTNNGLRPAEAIKSYFGAVPDHFNITGLQSGLYSLLTPVLALAGASYLFAPGMTLANVFGFVKGVDTFFWWQCIGGGLMTVAPATTYSLKKLADEDRLNEAVAKVLNFGVMGAALGHLAVLYPMLAANQGGPMLPWVLGAWGTALLTSGLGLFRGGAAKAAAGGA